MRILHVVAYYPPDRMGGVGEVVAHLHRALRDAGHDSSVVTTGVSCDDPTVERIARSPAGFVTRLAGQVRRVREFDVVHCHHGDALALLMAMRAARVRTPVLATFHVGHAGMGAAFRDYVFADVDGGRRVHTGGAGWRYRNVTARLHEAADRAARALATGSSYICRSAAIDQLGRDAGASARVIYNALPDAKEVGATADGASEIEPVELLYAGAGGHRKRVVALPFVLEAVRRRHPVARLRMVGLAEAEASDLRALFRERGVEDAVDVVGPVRSSEALRPFLRAARVFVVPSAYEGLPMVILEAMAEGLPVVATRVSGHPEAIDPGENGLLVPPDRPVALAEACSELLADEPRRRAMGERAKATVAERFGLARQRDAYLAMYRELVAAS